MADYDFHTLNDMTVAQLREIAGSIDHEAVQGYSQQHKDEVLHGICVALGIEEHEHHDVVGLDKRPLKKQIQELKQRRDAALEAHDSAELKRTRRQIHRIKRKIRRATV